MRLYGGMGTKMTVVRSTAVRVAEGGRIVIPAEFRKALGLKVGDKVILVLEGEPHPTPGNQACPGDGAPLRTRGVSLVDELLAERRAEAAGE